MKSNDLENNSISCHFTIKDIEELASISSFKRGESLYKSGAVQKITKTGNRYDAVVNGSRPYKVHIIDDRNSLHLDCNCPYDHEGICKHLVAFSLKILAGDYQVSSVIPTLSDVDFINEYSKIDTKKKLSFLEQLLDRDNDLRQQFFAFSESEAGKLDALIGEKIEEIRLKIHLALSDLDLDDLSYYDDYEHGYREHWEIEYDAAIEKIKGEFEPHIKSIITYIKKGNLLDAFRILLGLYEGIQDLPDLDNDNYVFDGEYNNEVSEILEQYFRDISNVINTIIKSNKATLEVVELIFDRISYYDNQKTSDERPIYLMKDFEILFQSLITNKEVAQFLYKKIQENHFESIDSAYILLNIAEISDDESLWIKTAEIYAENEAEIAKQLLLKYQSKNAIQELNRIAEMAFNIWPDQFDKYIIETIDKKQQEDLYVEALKNYVSRKSSIKYYKILKTYLTKEQTIDFVNKFRGNFQKVFYVQMLAVEKRYEDILPCIKSDIYFYDIDKLLKPVLNIYPSECYSIIIEINKEALEEPKRNRSTYQRMIKTLRLLKDITSKKQEAGAFLYSLYNHKPNLPALKDEMRRAKLI